MRATRPSFSRGSVFSPRGGNARSASARRRDFRRSLKVLEIEFVYSIDDLGVGARSRLEVFRQCPHQYGSKCCNPTLGLHERRARCRASRLTADASVARHPEDRPACCIYTILLRPEMPQG